MFVSCRSNHSSGRRIAAIALAIGAILLAAPVASQAQTTTIIGSLANFDAVNDTEGEKEGFEIQLEGIQSADITRVFGQAGATCYIRYCIGSITDVPAGTDPVTLLPRPAYVSVKWTANYNAVTKTFTPHTNAPAGSGPGTPSTFGTKPTLTATGESCWSLGAGAAYPTSGCEHFGISTAVGKNPTKTTYHWLAGDPATGALASVTVSPAGLPTTTPAAPVVIPQPVVNVIPPVNPANAPQVQVQIQGAAPFAPGAPLAHRYGKAQWVKVYKTEIAHDANLDDLQFKNPDVPDAQNNAGAVETEWKLLQFDVTKACTLVNGVLTCTKGGGSLQSHGSPNGGSRAVVRRYEFYKYAGAVVPPNGTSGGGKNGPVLSTDDQEASLLCTRAVPGDLATECVAPGPGEVGDFIGAQMVAQNLAGNRTTPLIAWPTPASIVYGTALSASQLDATATAAGAAVTGTFAYTPPAGTVLPAGVHTVQVLFTPDAPATFSSQTMTMQITVTKAPLTVVADHKTKVYGALDPMLTFVASGIQVATGDTEATVLSGALGRAIGSDVGSYAITAGTLATTSNYTLTFTGNTLEITPANLTISAVSNSKVYGATFAGAFSTSALLNSDTVNTVTLTSAGSAPTAPVGSYDIVPSAATGTGLTNYTISYVNGTLAVTPADLLVTAGNASKIYGATTFAGTFSTSALLNGDTVASVTLTSAGAGASAPVGSYSIVPSAALGTGLGNYTISYANGTLTVTPATLSVVANPQTKVAGTVDPALTFVASGFQAGDTAAVVLTGALARVAGEAPGTYAVTQGTLAANLNYTMAFTGNTLVITAPPPPPPPAGISIAPIANQSNTDGDEVELQVVVVSGSTPALSAAARNRDDDDNTHDRGGVFSATGLPGGLKIDRDGEISGRVKTNATAVTTFNVTVTFTQNGVTVSQRFVWKITPAAPRKGGKG